MTKLFDLETCPKRGSLVITSIQNLTTMSTFQSRTGEILVTQTCPTTQLEPITSIEDVMRALGALKKDLLQQGIHPPKNTFVGIPTNQLELIDIVLARTEGRQRSLLKSNLSELAFEEHSGQEKLVDSLKPLIAKIAKGTTSAEELAQMIASTVQPDQARRILAGNVSGSAAAEDLHAQLKSNEDLKIPNRSFKANQVYELTLSANSSNFEQMKGTATIVGTENDWKFFVGSNRSTARITLDFSNANQLRIFSLCLAFGIEFKARISPSIKVAASNLVFAGTLVDFLDLQKLHENVQKAEETFSSDLFGLAS